MIEYLRTKWRRFVRAWKANPPQVEVRTIPKE